jgi:anti-sigma factor RsiW
MKTNRSRTLRPQELAAYLEGQVSETEAAVIEARLAESAEARRQLEQLRSIRDALSSEDDGDESDQVELLPLVQDRIRRSVFTPTPRRPSVVRQLVQKYQLAAGALAALALAYVAGPLALDALEARDFREKSAIQTPSASRWAGIQAYRVRAGRAERLGADLSRGDELSFSYTNLGAEPFAHLMIFGVDASGSVRWFYPAYEQPGTDPGSITIEKGVAQKALAELIAHDFAAGPLTIHAVFSNQPLRVLEVEDWLGQPGGLAQRGRDLVDQVLTTRVEP